jgi:hypothetical protein
MPRPALLIAALTLLTTPALAGSNEWIFPANPDGTIDFIMPSGNVGCRFIPAGGTAVYHTATGQEELHCIRLEPTTTVVILQPVNGGHQPIASTEVPELPMASVLPYGAFWQAGAFVCVAARSGLVCVNGTGAGLRMSRAGVDVW